MATLVSQPPFLNFSSMIDDIVFSTNDENGVLVLELVCGGVTQTIMEETLYSSVDGSVVVGDLASLVEPYARKYLSVWMNCSFRDSSGTASITQVVILFGMVDVGTTAADFVANHFLSTLDGEKMTALGRAERIHAYNVSAVTVRADVLLANGQYNTLSAELTSADHEGSVYHFDVSPDNVISLIGLIGGRLLGYTVEAGSRRQDFRMVEDLVPPAPSLLFINSFGYEEFLHCVGTHKKDSKYDRKQARIGGRLRNYRVTEDRQLHANTGWLNEAMADWADELFRSESVFLWVNGVVGREVVLSDSKSEITNDDDNMPAFEFTYTYSQRIHNVMQSGRVARIFDNTFDRTFN